MPSNNPREFYANALGISPGTLSINDLQNMYWRTVSTLPYDFGAVTDHEYDFYKSVIYYPTDVSKKSLNDLQVAYWKSLGVNSQPQWEAGVNKVRRNLITNPGVRVDLTSYTMNQAGGTYTQTRETGGPTETPNWYKALSTVASVSSPAAITFAGILNISPGDVISCSAKLISSYTPWSSIRLEPVFRNAGSGLISAPATDARAYSTPDTWEGRAGTATAPANTVKADFQVVFSGPQSMPVGGHFGATAYLFEKAPAVGSYFDGTYPGCRWEGAPNASVSQKVEWTV